MEKTSRQQLSDDILEAWINVELPKINPREDGETEKRPGWQVSYIEGLKKIAGENDGWIPLHSVQLQIGSIELNDARFDEFRTEKKDAYHNKPDIPAAPAA